MSSETGRDEFECYSRIAEDDTSNATEAVDSNCAEVSIFTL